MNNHDKNYQKIIELYHDIIIDIISKDYNYYDGSEIAAVSSDIYCYFDNDFDGWDELEYLTYTNYLSQLIKTYVLRGNNENK